VSLALLRGLSSSYGVLASAEDAFDAMLALLSATSYTLRFAEDLEDVFPHAPFPSDHAQFLAAAELGREIRAVETFARQPGANFLKRSLARVETEPGETLGTGATANFSCVPTTPAAFRASARKSRIFRSAAIACFRAGSTREKALLSIMR
jgi:type ISP restriction-modification system protein